LIGLCSRYCRFNIVPRMQMKEIAQTMPEARSFGS
jgi:hypothetical protein